MIWPYIFLAYLSLFVFGLSDNVRGPLFPEIMREFHVTDSMGAMMFALSNISGFVSSYLARHLLRRYDRRSVLQGAAVTLTVSLWGLALAPHFYVFLFFSFTFGLSLGILGLIPNVLVPLGSSLERKQQMLAGLHSMYGVASLLAPLVAAAVEYVTGSWRWTFAVVSIAPLTLLLYSRHPSHHPLHKRRVHDAEAHRQNKKKNFKPQIFLALMVSFCVAAEIMVSSRLALFVRRTVIDDMEKASLYVTGFFVCMLAGRLLFTWLKLNASLRSQLSGCLILSAFTIGLGLYVSPFFLVLTGFTIGPFYPLAISWISTKFPEDLDTAVSYMMATDSMMLVAMHLGVGQLTDEAGITKALLLGPCFLFLSFIFVNSFEAFFEKKTTPSSDISLRA